MHVICNTIRTHPHPIVAAAYKGREWSTSINPLDESSAMNPPNAGEKEKSCKGYLKKLRKRASTGKVTTQVILQDCLRQGIEVKTGIHFMGKRHATQQCDITTEDLRKTIRSIMIPESQAPPTSLSVLNRAKYNKIMNLHLFNCDEPESFFAALSKEIKPSLKHLTVRVHKDSSRIHLLPDRLLSISGIDVEEEAKEEEEREDRKGSHQVHEFSGKSSNGSSNNSSSSKGIGKGEEKDRSGDVFSASDIESKLAQFVSSHSLMITWKYPLPIEESKVISHDSNLSIGKK